MIEFYQKYIDYHQAEAEKHMQGDIKIAMYHLGEVRNYKEMLKQFLSN